MIRSFASAIVSAADLQLEAFFFDRELIEFSAFHQFDDLLDLFNIQSGCLN